MRKIIKILVFMVGLVLILGMFVIAETLNGRTITLEQARVDALSGINITNPTLTNVICDGTICKAELKQYQERQIEQCYFSNEIGKEQKLICYNVTDRYTTLNMLITIPDNSSMMIDEKQSVMSNKIKSTLEIIADDHVGEQSKGNEDIGGGGDIIITPNKG